MPKFDAIFVGAGPVGLWTAVQYKLRNPEANILLFEKYTEYKRKHVLLLNKKSLKNTPDHPSFQEMIQAFESKIPTTKLESELQTFARKLGIEIRYEDITDCKELGERFPDCPYFIGSDGSHSVVRKQIFDNQLTESEDLSYVAEVKYHVTGETAPLNLYSEGLPVMTYAEFLVTETVGKVAENGTTPVTIRFIIDKETYEEMKAATFKNPYKLNNDKIPAALSRSIHAWLLGREMIAQEKRVADSEKLTVTNLPIYASKSVTVPNKKQQQQWLLVGDSAFGVPYFRSLNNGLLCGTELSIALTTQDFSNYAKYVKKLIKDEIATARWKNTGVSFGGMMMDAVRSTTAPLKRTKLKLQSGGREFQENIQKRSIEREMERKERARILPVVEVQSSSSSSTSTSVSAPVKPEKIVTVIGDSTFDNGAWLGTRYAALIALYTKGGVLGSRLLGVLAGFFAKLIQGIEEHDDITSDTQWPIERHLRNLLGKEYRLIDRSVDGFTTADVLNGAFEDKVGLPFFKKRRFFPLDQDGQAAIKASEAVVISVGGNNVREFILGLPEDPTERVATIRAEYPNVIATLRKEYIEIINKVYAMNPAARIVVMTQYYPGLGQVAGFGDFIYGFMKELGAVLHKQDPSFPTDPEQVIQRIIADTYRTGLQYLPKNIKLVIADVTSSINPTTNDNHINQIEPSHFGGEKIATMLAHLIKGSPEVEGHIFQFNFGKDFFGNGIYHEHKTSLESLARWQPRSISSFRWGKWKLGFDNPQPVLQQPIVSQEAAVNDLDDDNDMRAARR